MYVPTVQYINPLLLRHLVLIVNCSLWKILHPIRHSPFHRMVVKTKLFGLSVCNNGHLYCTWLWTFQTCSWFLVRFLKRSVWQGKCRFFWWKVVQMDGFEIWEKGRYWGGTFNLSSPFSSLRLSYSSSLVVLATGCSGHTEKYTTVLVWSVAL